MDIPPNVLVKPDAAMQQGVPSTADGSECFQAVDPDPDGPSVTTNE
jgi:hypothetical protein